MLLTCQIGRYYDAVQLRRVLDHDHGRAVDELMLDLELRKLVLEDLVHHLAPEPARRQHVGLVQRDDARVAPGLGQVAAEPRDALDLWFRVDGRVKRIDAVVLFSLAKVQARGQLADQHDVGAAADGRLERRGLDEGVRGEEAGAEVAVGAHLAAQPQEALLRADGAGAPFGAADGAEEHRVRGLGGGEGLVREGGAGLVDGALGRATPRLASDFSRGCHSACVVRCRGTTYPSEQVVLQIEFASSRAQLLDRLDNLCPASVVLSCRSQIPDSYLDCLGNNLSI